VLVDLYRRYREALDATVHEVRPVGYNWGDLVAMMHEVPGVVVEKRTKLPVLQSKTGRRREIDVLITSNVAGYPVRFGIGCKNEGKKAVLVRRVFYLRPSSFRLPRANRSFALTHPAIRAHLCLLTGGGTPSRAASPANGTST
jgi:hypothetical protein